MPTFSIEDFARSCKAAMAAAPDRHRAASEHLERTLAEHSPEEMTAVLEAAIPAGADIGEMILHQSPELTMLYGRLPARFETGIHDHTVFACIGQLSGRERNVFYRRDPEAGLRVSGEHVSEPGSVLDLGAEVIHHVENPDARPSTALHIYGGDFKAVQGERTLWTAVGFEEKAFSFPDLMRECAAMMKRDGNEAGLEAMVAAIPSMKGVVESV